MARRPVEEAVFISPKGLAERWAMSRTGVVKICERVGIPSTFLGGEKEVKQARMRRFRISDIEAYEEKCAENQAAPPKP